MSSGGRLFQVCVNTGFRGMAGAQESKHPCHIGALNAQERLQDRPASVNTAADKGPLQAHFLSAPTNRDCPKAAKQGRACWSHGLGHAPGTLQPGELGPGRS